MSKTDSPSSLPRARSERAIVLLVAMVVLVNVLDFMMVLPLGPDLARGLGIEESNLGFVGGSYTATSALGALLGSFFLDRFDRRTALAVVMFGLTAATAVSGLATNMPILLASRFVAGFFGGPSVALAYAIITDVVPEQRRGSATAAISATFSVASVLGVPAGLWLAQVSSWRLPLLTVAALGLAANAFAYWALPPLRLHMEAARHAPRSTSMAELFSRRSVQVALAINTMGIMSSFCITPLLPSYVTGNLGVPRDQLQWLFLVGGAVNFGVLRLVGRLVDRFGAVRIGTLASGLFLLVLYGFLYSPIAALPVVVPFTLFMVATSMRSVSYNTLATNVPHPSERARFQCLRSVTQDLGATAAALLGTQLASQVLQGSGDQPLVFLEGMPRLALFSAALTLLIPWLMAWLAGNLRATMSASTREADHLPASEGSPSAGAS